MMGYVVSNSGVQFFNLFSENDVFTAELGISLLEKFELTFKQTCVFFKLNLSTLVVIDNMVFEYANFILHVGRYVRIVEVKLLRQKDVTRFEVSLNLLVESDLWFFICLLKSSSCCDYCLSCRVVIIN